MTETDWWWIDYLENDLDPTTNADIEYLLEHSESDQDEFERWRVLRAWVKESDPIPKLEELWSPEDLKQQSTKIMKALEDSERRDQSAEVSLRVL